TPPSAQAASSQCSFGVRLQARDAMCIRARVGGERKRPTTAGEVGHGRVAEEVAGSDEGKRPTGHTDPVLGGLSNSENGQSLPTPSEKVNELSSPQPGSGCPTDCWPPRAALGCATVTMIVFGPGNRGIR